MTGNESKEEEVPSSSTTSSTSSSSSSWAISLANLSTPLLQSKLEALEQESSQLSTTLTAKLASSPSGQSLLHIGPSLSSLPPDLETLLETLKPFVSDVNEFHVYNEKELERIVTFGRKVEKECRRALHAKECREWFLELQAVEGVVQMVQGLQEDGADARDYSELDTIDMMASIERLAYTTLSLLKELEKCSTQVTLSLSKNRYKQQKQQEQSVTFDTEQTQFWLKLSPRIRQLEKDACRIITSQFEQMLVNRNKKKDNNGTTTTTNTSTTTSTSSSTTSTTSKLTTEQELVCLGHLLRSLAYLNKGNDAETIFSRVAIVPIVRSKVSMGRLDEGGSRGECVGLFPLLQEVAYAIYDLWGDVLRLNEGIFELDPSSTTAATITATTITATTAATITAATGSDSGSTSTSGGSGGDDEGMNWERPIDLVTSCWTPIATNFMTDPAIKMALFSPGIGSILQANYKAVDTFLTELASILLKEPTSAIKTILNDTLSITAFGDESVLEQLYYQPTVSPRMIQKAQFRLYGHTSTIEFFKKWNLPIYYQLRFGEACTRLDKALHLVQEKGLHTTITSDGGAVMNANNRHGLELSLCTEVYDILVWMWNENVFLRPLTNRFLRGATQMVSRFVVFMKEGLDGKILFADPVAARLAAAVRNSSSAANGEGEIGASSVAAPVSKSALSLKDIATVSRDLSILEQVIQNDYVSEIEGMLQCPGTNGLHGNEQQQQELIELIREVLAEATQEITPIIQSVWDETIVRILTMKCSAPLSAVKGVAATYRMTNRPAPTRPSPYVSTILKPLKEFNTEFITKIPSCVGSQWKETIVASIAMKYSKAVSELLETVQRTEEALKNRKARRTVAGGMSDGEKVKLQLLLDHKEFMASVRDIGVDPLEVEGVRILKDLTAEAEDLLARRS